MTDRQRSLGRAIALGVVAIAMIVDVAFEPEAPRRASVEVPAFVGDDTMIRLPAPVAREERPLEHPPATTAPLDADELERLTRSSFTTACWQRSHQAEHARIASVKKLTVTLDVAPDGTVWSVAFKGVPPDTMLERCLRSVLRSPLRPNLGGTFSFTMFAQ